MLIWMEHGFTLCCWYILHVRRQHLQIQDQIAVHLEVQVSQDYVGRPCLLI